MMTPPIDRFRQAIAVNAELAQRYIAECSDAREVAFESLHALFTLRAANVIFAACMFVLDHGVANHHCNAGRQRKQLVFEGTAIEQNGLIKAAETRCEL